MVNKIVIQINMAVIKSKTAAKKAKAVGKKSKPAAKKSKPAVIKTKATEASVEAYINSLKDEQQRNDSFQILEMMQKESKEQPKMWGSAMIGFGVKKYKSERTGREVDWFKIGFSPRKANISLHLVLNINDYASDLKKLGKHKTGVGCLYINKLEDIDVRVLRGMIKDSLKSK